MYRLILLFLFSTFLFSQNLEKVVLQLNWKHQFEFAGFYMAKEKGFYKEVGIDVEFREYEKYRNVIDELIYGKSQYAIAYSSFLIDYLNGKPLVFLANFLKQSPLILITQEDIHTPKDLIGKKIMGVDTSLDNAVLLSMFSKFGLRQDSYMKLPPSFNINDFIEKKVDGMLVFNTNETHFLTDKNLKYNVFNPMIYGSNFYDLNLITSQEELKNNPKRVKAFKEASIKGWEYALKNKEEAIDIIIKKYNTQNKTKAALTYEAVQIENLMHLDSYEIGSIDKQRVEDMINDFSKIGFVGQTNDFSDLFLKESFFEKIDLSKEEIEFIKNNPIVKIGGGISFEPFVMRNDKGEIVGYDREIADLIEEKTGLKIKFELDIWSKTQEKAAKSELDGLTAVISSKEREKIYNFTNSYISYTPVVIINKSNSNKIVKKSDLIGKKLALQKDNAGFFKIAKSLGDVKIVYYDTLHDVLNAVVKNEVDFTILDDSIFYLADKLGVLNYISTPFIVGDKVDLYFALTNKKPLLQSIFNKALNSINQFQRKEIKNKWFKIVRDENLNFTNKEKNYLYEKEDIKICIDPNWYPFEKLQNGKHIGMSADFLKLLEEKINVNFNLQKTESWSESLAKSRKRECDILPLAMPTEKRKEYMNFTKPYIFMPLVLATKNSFPFIDNLDNLKDVKVGIVKDYAFNEILRDKYSNFEIVDVKNIQDGLDKVSNGELDGFIGTLATINFEFQKSYFDEMKIAGKFDEKWELGIAVRNDDKTLLSIFNKLVDSVSFEEKQEIMNKYISVKYEQGIDYSLIYKILIISIVIIFIFAYKNNIIRKEKDKIEQLNKQLKEKEYELININKKLERLSSTDKLTNIFNRRKIDEALIKELERSKRIGKEFSLIMVDIDHFKSVNDTFGHQVGDEVLSSVSNLIKQSIRQVDIFGRWGGEEFLIICPYTENEGAITKAEKIRKMLEDFNFKTVGKKTASFGVTTSIKSDNLNTILKRVDTALYRAKETGRNKVVYE